MRKTVLMSEMSVAQYLWVELNAGWVVEDFLDTATDPRGNEGCVHIQNGFLKVLLICGHTLLIPTNTWSTTKQ